MSENNTININKNYYRHLEIGYYFLFLSLPLHFLYRLRASLSFDAILLICFLPFYTYIFYRNAKSSIWALKYKFETDYLYIDYYDNTQAVIDLRDISTISKKESLKRSITIDYSNGKKTTFVVNNPDTFMTIFEKLEGYKS